MLKIYNTLANKKESFKPSRDKRIGLFVCGPTVYDFPHIGHARTYIVFDAIAKYLKDSGFNVFYLQNITDIDDKIINRAKEKNVLWKTIARNFEKEYLKDMKDLGVNSVSKYARATKHIKEIIDQIRWLIKPKYAYKSSDGIYFDISKFKKYGALSGRTVLQAEDAVSRIDEATKKRNKGDFCLWKFWSKDKSEPKWKSPWGLGRPGWHIEDTAIAQKYFGFQYDMHGGGMDLIFPHHEAEIAQMESLSGKSPMAKYWLHTGFLSVGGQKMSKSLGNFITIRDFLKSNPARILRYIVLKSHYRSPLNYEKDTIFNARNDLERIAEFIEKIQNVKSRSQNDKEKFKIDKFKKDFWTVMNDDFNTPKAISVIFEMIREINPLLDRGGIEKEAKKEILNFLKTIDKIFGFIFDAKKEVPENIRKLVKKRDGARQKKDWALADKIRKEIEALGFKIKDTQSGPKIRKI